MHIIVVYIVLILIGLEVSVLGQEPLPVLQISNISSSSAQISWKEIKGATIYKLKYRTKGGIYWNNFISSLHEKTLQNLLPHCIYEVQVAAVDHEGFGNYTSIQNFQTLIPRPDHIVLLIMENHGYSSVIGSPAAPYLNALVHNPSTALFSNSHGIQHPSQPNYLHLFSGSNQGVNTNDKPLLPFTSPNLFGYLYQSGIRFKCYSEDLPYQGFNGEFNGAYARKHNPVTNWMGSDTNQVPSDINVPIKQFPENLKTLPEFCYIVPNQDNDMHNGIYPTNIIAGDDWIKTHLDKYVQWTKNNNSLLIITFDEDNWMDNNRIPTLFYGPMIKGGTYNDSICHYHVLRTLEEIYNVAYSGNSMYVHAIDCWKNDCTGKELCSTGQDSSILSNFSYYPNPAVNILSISFNLNVKSNVRLELFDIKGEKVRSGVEESIIEPGIYERIISTENYLNGIYFIRLSSGDEHYDRKIIIYH